MQMQMQMEVDGDANADADDGDEGDEDGYGDAFGNVATFLSTNNAILLPINCPGETTRTRRYRRMHTIKP